MDYLTKPPVSQPRHQSLKKTGRAGFYAHDPAPQMRRVAFLE
jgi:hypothetical protein